MGDDVGNLSSSCGATSSSPGGRELLLWTHARVHDLPLSLSNQTYDTPRPEASSRLMTLSLCHGLGLERNLVRTDVA